MTDEGFVWQHSDRVLTVFSAADYCGCGNRGAVLIISADWSRRVDSFAPPPPGAVDVAAAPAEAPRPLLPYFLTSSAGT